MIPHPWNGGSPFYGSNPRVPYPMDIPEEFLEWGTTNYWRTYYEPHLIAPPEAPCPPRYNHLGGGIGNPLWVYDTHWEPVNPAIGPEIYVANASSYYPGLEYDTRWEQLQREPQTEVVDGVSYILSEVIGDTHDHPRDSTFQEQPATEDQQSLVREFIRTLKNPSYPLRALLQAVFETSVPTANMPTWGEWDETNPLKQVNGILQGVTRMRSKLCGRQRWHSILQSMPRMENQVRYTLAPEWAAGTALDWEPIQMLYTAWWVLQRSIPSWVHDDQGGIEIGPEFTWFCTWQNAKILRPMPAYYEIVWRSSGSPHYEFRRTMLTPFSYTEAQWHFRRLLQGLQRQLSLYIHYRYELLTDTKRLMNQNIPVAFQQKAFPEVGRAIPNRDRLTRKSLKRLVKGIDKAQLLENQ